MSIRIEEKIIDAPELAAMLKEAFQLGVAWGVQPTIVFDEAGDPRVLLSNTETIRRSNDVLKVTLRDLEWCTRFVDYLLEKHGKKVKA